MPREYVVAGSPTRLDGSKVTNTANGSAVWWSHDQIHCNGVVLFIAKYILELTEEQGKITSQACEFFARIKMGQFQEIPYLCLRSEISGGEYCARRNIAEKHLLDARKAIYPELNGIGHSYGVGKFQDADRAFDVYQVLRHALGDSREPYRFGEPLPVCRKTVLHTEFEMFETNK